MSEWEYAEQILHVDLSNRVARVEATSIDLKRSFVGGAGFVARLLTGSRGMARVALATGPLSDGMAGRLSMGAAPGPDGRLALSSMGGRMAAALKGSGFDALVIHGELDRPGVLLVDPDGVQVVDAGALWGMDVPGTERVLRGEVGPGWASMVLGPAAENAVPFSTLAHEGHYAGGSGVAAVLGAKRIKAVLVHDAVGVPATCTGCTLACPGKLSCAAQTAGDLGLDAPTAERMAALATAAAEAGILPRMSEPFIEMAHRTGVGSLLALGEEMLLERLGPAVEPLVSALPPRKKRGGPGVADLLGTCQRVWKERPGQVLREALTATQGLLTSAAV
ncbi:MAG: aldehyde ferredoxin oxidoreductase N-terminal domain-containing protein [Bacillota bacterium]